MPPDFFRTHTRGLDYGDGVLDEASGEVGVQDGAGVKGRSRENSTMECQ